MDLFHFTSPTADADADAAPVLIDVPHAGEYEPEAIAARAVAPFEVRKRDFDLYVDRLWQDAPEHGIPLLSATHSRYCVDLNRSPDDVDAGSVEGHPNPEGTFRRGLLWQVTAAGEVVLDAPLPREAWRERVARFHAPYHDQLRATLDSLRERFGRVLLIDGHSMPSVGRADHPDSGARRADVVPGDNHGRACPAELTALCAESFAAEGYSVAVNTPYSGGWITRHYGRPERDVYALQLEVRRDLYMNEDTFEIDPEGLARLRAACLRFARAAADWMSP